ncbi:hypothetical protein KP509_16G080700 [Ceratopteris richardii]|uniref:mannan endo-1,4-beta-mannosidase n=1 Tax=Ceratopteris richardii TaxID=49495 RepID=A0A8T2T283_CERRI|nr:hypothetical protein KP509_16G080700 [Ceratopteris richardii]
MGSLSFVATKGSQFVVDGKPYYINGFNAYFLMAISVDSYSRPRATMLLEEAAAAGLNTCRTWAFNDGNGYEALQTSPGVYDERVFQALDFVLSEAKRVGIRLILSLSNNWKDYGGKAQYVQWAQKINNNASAQLSSEDAFFSDATCTALYKNHVQTVLTRINTITGVPYKNDPTIFSWELMNEPRCLSDQSGAILQAWIEEMAPYVKSIDSNHLLQVGLEGFYGPSSSVRVDANPNSYCQQLGTDFIKNHQVPGVDYATIHAYPDSWLGWNVSVEDRIAFMKSWISVHAADCSSGGNLQMPLVLAEVGLSQWSGGFTVANRDRLMAATYAALLESARASGAAAGALIWQLFPPGMDNWSDGYQILLSKDISTAAIITQQSQDIAALNANSAPPSATPSRASLISFPGKLRSNL